MNNAAEAKGGPVFPLTALTTRYRQGAKAANNAPHSHRNAVAGSTAAIELILPPSHGSNGEYVFVNGSPAFQ